MAFDSLRQRLESRTEVHGYPGVYVIRESDGLLTPVETYWTKHTVKSSPFRSASGSLRYLEWRSAEYPLFHQLMELWGDHSDQTVLDFGCGPANDLVGLLVHGRAKHVIGVDISETSLRLSQQRLALHRIDPTRVTLIKASDDDPRIDLPDQSVDHIYCEGVLHHSSHPAALLAEFRRIIRPNGRAIVMVYNRDSIFFHLHVAYRRQLLLRQHDDASTEEAFRHSTDGEDCPISIAYRPSEFVGLANSIGLRATFRGGYFYGHEELRGLGLLGSRAIADPRLGPEHRQFLAELERDDSGYPTWNGNLAGIGGVYELRV